MRYSLEITLLALYSIASAQTPEVLWQYSYGDSNDQYCRSMIQSDSCFYLAGADTSDLSLMKINPDGVLLWSKTYGGSEQQFAEDCSATFEGGLILTGWTSYSGDVDLWLLKLDSDGELEWSKVFGDSVEDRGFSVIQTSDGGYAALGSQLDSNCVPDVFLMKTDSSGNLEWESSFGGNDSDIGFSVCETSDAGFILTGFTFVGDGDCDLWLIKTDSAGNMQWEQKFGGILEEVGYSVLQTADGGYIALGYTLNQITVTDILLIKTDELGNEQWSETYGGADWDIGDCLIQTLNDGYAFTGSITDENSINSYVIKVDSNGTVEWEYIIGDSSSDEYGYSIVQLNDGSYAVAGDERSFATGDYNMLLTHLSSPQGIGEEYISSDDNLSIVSISPNPVISSAAITVFVPTTTFAEVSVFDVFGRLVAEIQGEVLESGENTISWDGTDAAGNFLSSGIYVIQIQSQDQSSSVNAVILR